MSAQPVGLALAITLGSGGPSFGGELHGSSLYDRLGGASAIAGQLTAIGALVVAPMIRVGLIVRKWLVTGLTLGAVTGE
jgi:hypothetical protein